MPDSSEEEQHHAIVCDRPSAREARRVVRNVLEPLAKSMGATLADTCPLAADQDHLLLHEAQKEVIRQSDWKCKVCGKHFKSEHYLDLHLHRKHAELLQNISAQTCLGEFCDLLQCPSWLNGLRWEAANRPRPCKPSELDARRHLCQHLMHECFLPGAAVAAGAVDMHHVYEAMEERLCSPVTCAGRALILETGSSSLLADVHDAEDDFSTGYYIFASILICGIGTLYFIVLCTYGEQLEASLMQRGDGELRARRRRQGGGFMDSLGFGKAKPM